MDLTEEQYNNRIASYWSWVAKREELGYWNMPGWTEHQNLLASHDPQKNWLEFLQNHLAGEKNAKGHALSLGCGGGWCEKMFLEKEICSSADGCDISPDLIVSAQKKADNEKLPLNYFVADLNHPNFPKKKYDLVIAIGILHHIKNLEKLFENITETLKDNGKLIVYDYVGPSRFQWKKEQIERCNYWLGQLPKKYRKKRGYPWYYYVGKTLFDFVPFATHPTVEKTLKNLLPTNLFAQWMRIQRARLIMDEMTPPPPEQFVVTDPSEAIRSDEILPVLKKYFEIEKLIPQGGTLTQPLFGRTVANYLNDPEGIRLAQKIFEDEREQIHSGKLPSDLVAFIATKRKM